MGRRRFLGNRLHPGGFVGIPHVVLRSPQFISLSPQAVKLLFDLLSQYKGDNNGDLCATWTLMEKRGWRSRDTLRKALRELESGGWVQRMRQGGMHVPTLYAVTFLDFDRSLKHDRLMPAFVPRRWEGEPPRTPKKRPKCEHAGRVNPVNVRHALRGDSDELTRPA